jgi:rubrerythrin
MTIDFDVDRFNEAVAENTEQHHESMRTIDHDIRDLHAETRRAVGGASRRDFLIRSALATTAVTVGSQVLPIGRLFTGIAGAQALTDQDIAAFAASIEYAAVETYKAAAGTGKVTTKAVADAATSFAGQHKAHGDAFAGASGGKISKDTPNATLVKSLSTQLGLAADETDVVELAFMVENAAAATYQFAMGALMDANAQKLAASILAIEAGHAAVLGQVLYNGDATKDKTWLPAFQTEAGFIDPAKTPISLTK